MASKLNIQEEMDYDDSPLLTMSSSNQKMMEIVEEHDASIDDDELLSPVKTTNALLEALEGHPAEQFIKKNTFDYIDAEEDSDLVRKSLFNIEEMIPDLSEEESNNEIWNEFSRERLNTIKEHSDEEENEDDREPVSKLTEERQIIAT